MNFFIKFLEVVQNSQVSFKKFWWPRFRTFVNTIFFPSFRCGNTLLAYIMRCAVDSWPANVWVLYIMWAVSHLRLMAFISDSICLEVKRSKFDIVVVCFQMVNLSTFHIKNQPLNFAVSIATGMWNIMWLLHAHSFSLEKWKIAKYNAIEFRAGISFAPFQTFFNVASLSCSLELSSCKSMLEMPFWRAKLLFYSLHFFEKGPKYVKLTLPIFLREPFYIFSIFYILINEGFQSAIFAS